MTQTPHKYLMAVQAACELLMRFVEDKDYEDYRKDEALRWAVERQCKIIGEGLSHALNVDPDVADAITDVDEVICLRRVLGHTDVQVDDETVWHVLKNNVPALHCEVAAYLRDAGQAPEDVDETK